VSSEQYIRNVVDVVYRTTAKAWHGQRIGSQAFWLKTHDSKLKTPRAGAPAL